MHLLIPCVAAWRFDCVFLSTLSSSTLVLGTSDHMHYGLWTMTIRFSPCGVACAKGACRGWGKSSSCLPSREHPAEDTRSFCGSLPMCGYLWTYPPHPSGLPRPKTPYFFWKDIFKVPVSTPYIRSRGPPPTLIESMSEEMSCFVRLPTVYFDNHVDTPPVQSFAKDNKRERATIPMKYGR